MSLLAPHRIKEWRQAVLDLQPVGYWPLGELTGVARNWAASNAANGTVTIGVGARHTVALNDGGDGGILYDGLDTNIAIANGTAIASPFSAGATLLVLLQPTDSGEGGAGRIWSKNNMIRMTNEAGGLSKLNFTHSFSVATGEWTTTNTVIANGQIQLLAWTFDGSSDANNPSIYIFNKNTRAFLNLGVGSGITENTAPSGTANADTAAINIGSDGAGSATFKGILDESVLIKRVLSFNSFKELAELL